MRKIVSFIMSLLMLLSSFSEVFAGDFVKSEDEALQKLNLYVKQDKGVQLLKWKGIIDSKNFATAIIMYKDADGNEFPAYCGNPQKSGVEDLPAKQYDIDICPVNLDPRVWTIITNGYPYKTPEEMGVSTEYEAYYVTKMVLWATIHGNYTNLDDWQANGEQNKAVEIAMKALAEKGKAAGSIDNTWITVSPKQTIAEPKEEGLVQEFDVKSNVKIDSYTVTLNGNIPSGTKIKDINGNEKSTFGENDTSFKVVIPKTNTERNGTFDVIVKSNIQNKSVIFGLSDNPKTQDYYITENPLKGNEVNAKATYKEVNGDKPDEPDEPDTPDNPPGTGLQILKVKAGTTQGLEGAVFKVSDSKGSVIGHYVTDKNGKISISDLSVGVYYIEETQAPSGYLLDENSHKHIELKKDINPTIVTFSNEESANLEIIKVDADTGEKLGGAAIRVAYDGGNDFVDVITGPSGKAVISNLKSGTYTVTELTAPEGYLLDLTPQSIKLEAGKKATLTI